MANLGALKELPAVAWVLVMFGIFLGAGLWVLAIFFNITNGSASTQQAATGIGYVISALNVFASQTTNIVYIVVIGIIIAVVFWAIGYHQGGKGGGPRG